jgi:hypothetical protein
LEEIGDGVENEEEREREMRQDDTDGTELGNNDDEEFMEELSAPEQDEPLLSPRQLRPRRSRQPTPVQPLENIGSSASAHKRQKRTAIPAPARLIEAPQRPLEAHVALPSDCEKYGIAIPEWLKEWNSMAKILISDFEMPNRGGLTRLVEGYDANVADRAIDDENYHEINESTIVYARRDGKYEIALAVFMGSHALTPHQLEGITRVINKWAAIEELRPPPPATGKRSGMYQRDKDIGNWSRKGTCHGGVFVQRAATLRIHTPTTETYHDVITGDSVKDNRNVVHNYVAIGYHEVLRAYENLGICERFGEVLYLLDPPAYRERRDVVKHTHTFAKKFLAPRDINTVHFFAFNTTIGPHRDVMDAGLVFQYMTGDYSDGETCIVDLGVRIKHTAGTFFAFQAGSLLHYAKRFTGTRILHTMHVQSFALDAYRQYKSVWEVLGTDWTTDEPRNNDLAHVRSTINDHIHRERVPHMDT